ncbi:MAG: immunity 22 family protein [Helicobacteraceae bacterium]|jgi:hypothetical protein|nr:immunity 22 family protein [Helicobacteraceae bacterium]
MNKPTMKNEEKESLKINTGAVDAQTQPNKVNIMNKIFLWVGFTSKSEQEYWDYFSPKNGQPQFCFDTDLDWLDEDFMGYYYSNDTDDLKIAIENTPESGLYDIMYDSCISKGIKKANAMFYYTGNDIDVINENRKYNDLTFIGVFDWS